MKAARRRGGATLWIALVLVAVVAVVWSRRAKTRKPQYRPNAFYEVKRADMLISIKEDGALRALNETVVRSGLEGMNRIIRLAPEGLHVKKGDLLVEFDSATLKDRLNEQELAYQDRLFLLLQAKENLSIQKSLAQSQIKDAELKVELAQSDLEKYRDGDAPLVIRTVEARLAVIKEQVRIATERLARTEQLVKQGNATRSELEADTLTLKREQLALSQYEEDLRLIKKFDQPNEIRLLQSKVQQAKEELERLKLRTANEIEQAEADLKTSERAAQVMEDAIKTQKQRVANSKIVAPQDGLVVYASINPWQYVSPGARDEGRFRVRGPGTGADFGGRGPRGDRRGRGGSSDSSASSASGSGGSTSSISRTITAASATTGASPAGSAQTQNEAGNASGGGGGGGSLKSGGGGQGSGSSMPAFASFPSMRPSSTIPKANAAAANSSGGGGGPSSSSPSSGSSSGSPSQTDFTGGQGVRFNARPPSNDGYEVFTSSTVIEEGMMVRNRQELIRLPDVSKMMAEIKIHESRARQVRPGMTARVSIVTLPGRIFKGTVRRVALLPDAQMNWLNPEIKVHPTDILIDEELPELKPGVSARAEVIITNLTKVLSVPIQAVARFDGTNVCFVQKGSSVSPTTVTTGWFNEEFVEIVSGLKEGDRVLLAPIGDEDFVDETAPATNAVETAPPPREEVAPAPPGNRNFQRAEDRSADTNAPDGRRRNRGPGRRERNSERDNSAE